MTNGEVFKDLPEDSVVEQLCQAKGFRVERVVSYGDCSPEGRWYDLDCDAWVVMIRGGVTLQLDEPEETKYVATGDWIFLPAHRRHRVESSSKEPPAIWLAVYGSRSDD